ncbi:MAG TPA: hypothetical protein VFZ17_12120 [Acidimicrobiia bacterium]|nr:hypothetical protein [Acidimicrobiia bacterium]
MREVAIGLRSGEGGAACVALARTAGALSVVGRRAVALTEPTATLAPFHAATEAPDRADEIIDAAVAYANVQAEAVVADLVAELGDVAHVGVVLGNAPPPDRALALRSHVASHAAEGALHRDALLYGASSTGLPVFALPEREVLGALAAAWPDGTARLDALHESAGRPWRKPEKLAAAIAILSFDAGVAAE